MTYAKTTCTKLYIYIGVGARNLYINEAHTEVDIFCFAVFYYKINVSGETKN